MHLDETNVGPWHGLMQKWGDMGSMLFINMHVMCMMQLIRADKLLINNFGHSSSFWSRENSSMEGYFNANFIRAED